MFLFAPRPSPWQGDASLQLSYFRIFKYREILSAHWHGIKHFLYAPLKAICYAASTCTPALSKKFPHTIIYFCYVI